MQKTIDFDQASYYELKLAKDRSLDYSATCTYVDSTGTTQNFDFSPYTGATLTVKNSSGTILMVFSTNDGSTLLLPNGIFRLIKTDTEMDTVRAGTYQYDMYLSSFTVPKRAFLYGNVSYRQNVGN